MKFGERLRLARSNMGWSQIDLAEKSGVSQATISKIERGDQEQSVHTPILAATLGVSSLWLANGTGFADQEADFIARRDSRVNGILQWSNNNTEPTPWQLGKVPLISSVQAGNWREVMDNFSPGDAEEWIPAPAKHGLHAYALRVLGSSMEPRFHEGEIVVVDPDIPPTSGRFVIAKKVSSQEVTLKQLMTDAGESYLKAINPQWPEPIMRITEEWIICGTVICKIELF